MTTAIQRPDGLYDTFACEATRLDQPDSHYSGTATENEIAAAVAAGEPIEVIPMECEA